MDSAAMAFLARDHPLVDVALNISGAVMILTTVHQTMVADRNGVLADHSRRAVLETGHFKI
jgi:hypothetical protein